MVDKNQEQYIVQLEREVVRLNELAEISTVLNSTMQIDYLLEYIMDRATEITDSEAASVLLWNQNTKQLFFAATSSQDTTSQDLIGKPVPLNSLAGTILKENRIIEVDDAASDPRHYQQVDEDIQFVTRSLLGVPMRSKDKVLGVLEVINKRELPWTKQDHHYLSILADQAAVAIENAQLVRALRKANEELSQVDKLKSDFIAIASHELRTPLGVILGYASFLQEDAQGSQVGDLAGKVMDSALQLRQIIEGMVNLRYLKQSTVELQREKITVNELLEDVVHDMLTLVATQGHTLERQDAPPDALVYVDRARVTMGLTNIVNNAIRFTPSGGLIRIAAEIHENEAWISVTDNGIGLASDQLEKVFTEFYQAEDHLTRQHGGLGVGLCITKAMADAHGGRTWATSPGLNQGATFTVALPLFKPALEASGEN